MAHTTAEWIAAVDKMRGYVATYLAVKGPLSDHQRASLATDLKTLDHNLEELADSLAAGALVVVAPGAPSAALSSDPSIALAQIRAATGHPITLDASGATIGLDASAVIGAATPEQIRELALLGFFGQPGLIAAVDYSLFEQYYESTGDDNWAPKGPYLNTGTWAAYVASKT